MKNIEMRLDGVSDVNDNFIKLSRNEALFEEDFVLVVVMNMERFMKN